MTFPLDPNSPMPEGRPGFPLSRYRDKPLAALWPLSDGSKPDLNDEWMQMVNLDAWVSSAQQRGRDV